MKGLPLSETHELSADGKERVMKEKYAIPYRASVKAQLDSWVAGKPIHNDYSDECCPDFSCCHPEGMWTEEKRKLFVRTTGENRLSMLLGELTKLASSEKVEDDIGIHVSGTVPKDHSIH